MNFRFYMFIVANSKFLISPFILNALIWTSFHFCLKSILVRYLLYHFSFFEITNYKGEYCVPFTKLLINVFLQQYKNVTFDIVHYNLSPIWQVNPFSFTTSPCNIHSKQQGLRPSAFFLFLAGKTQLKVTSNNFWAILALAGENPIAVNSPKSPWKCTGLQHFMDHSATAQSWNNVVCKCAILMWVYQTEDRTSGNDGDFILSTLQYKYSNTQE